MKQIVKTHSHTQYFIETFRQGYYSILCNRFQVNCYYIFYLLVSNIAYQWFCRYKIFLEKLLRKRDSIEGTEKKNLFTM